MLTKKTLKKLGRATKKVEDLSIALSDQIETAKERGKDNTVKVKRKAKKGEKTVDVKESDLWIEVRYGSEQAIDVLKKKYPKVWETSKAKEEALKERREIETEILGCRPNEMNLYKHILITLDIIKNYEEIN